MNRPDAPHLLLVASRPPRRLDRHTELVEPQQSHKIEQWPVMIDDVTLSETPMSPLVRPVERRKRRHHGWLPGNRSRVGH